MQRTGIARPQQSGATFAGSQTHLYIQYCSRPLANGGDAFWLDDRTIGHVVASSSSSSSESSKNQNQASGHELYAISVKFTAESLNAPESPVLIGTFPPGTSPVNFRFIPNAARLVFSHASVGDAGWVSRTRHTV